MNNNFIVLCTKKGIIKKTSLEAYSRPRTNGVIAITVRDGDELLDAVLTNGHSEILLAGRHGRCCRFDENDARALGRTASGVRGINIDDDDEVIGMIAYDPTAEDASAHSLLVVSEHGYGKRSDFDEYRKTNRGGKGVKTLNITEKTAGSALPAVQAAAAFDYPMMALNVIERLLAILVHIGLTVIVFYSVQSAKKAGLLAAVLLHMVVDTFAALYQRSIVPLWAVEVWTALWTAVIISIAVRLYRQK